MRTEEKETLIKKLLEDDSLSTSAEAKLDRLSEQIDLIMNALIIQQKDAAQLAGVSAATIRNYAKEGKIQPLQKDGSRLNFFTLKDVDNIKRRNTSKK